MTATRSGAALIIALVILAALMLLGLPFLISQSSALSGTRSFSHGQTATVGQGAAENAGIGAAASAFGMHLVSGAERGQSLVPPVANLPDQDWSRLFLDLGGAVRVPQLAYADQGVNSNRLGLDLSSWPLASTPVNGAILGTHLEDESGKLDPNALDAAGWSILLAANQIVDWDDGDGAMDDHDSLGQLAQALAGARFDPAVLGQTPTTGAAARITDLYQLLRAAPQGSQHRPGLTKSELERLRPHLTLHVLAQARGGLIDLGTVMADASGAPVLDSAAPALSLAFPLGPNLVGAGTVVASGDDGLRGRMDNHDFASVTTGHRPAAGERVAIEAQPAVNLHQASGPVLTVLNAGPAGTTSPVTGIPEPATLGALKAHPQATQDALKRPLTDFDSLDPVSSYRELGHSDIGQSQPADPGVNGSPIFDTDATTALLTAGANLIRVSNGPFANLPRSGWARIEGVSAGSAVPVVEYVYYDGSSLPNGSAAATLYPVRRGQSPSPGNEVFALAHAFKVVGTRITFLDAVELPPLAIASRGVVTIESAATVTDPVGKPDAQRARRVVAQAVPQEQQLETRWTTQAQLRALLAGRNGSLMASFPLADTRLRNYPPKDVADTGTLDIDHGTGLRPAIMRMLASASFTNWSPTWFVPFAGSTAATDAAAGLLPDYFLSARTSGSGTIALPLAPAASPTLDQRLNPEGFEVDSGDVLIYPQPGFWTLSGIPQQVLDTRNFAIWFKPNAVVTQDFTLFDMRIPLANAGAALQSPVVGDPGSAFDPRAGSGDNALQNHVTLRYDSAHQQLVLRVTPPAIEHPTDYGPTTGLNDPAAASDAQSSVVPANPMLAPLQPTMAIEQRYQLSLAMLDPSTWHHVQGTVAGNAPGMMALIVDGVVGRDVSTMSPLPSTLSVGDQFPSPCLQLADELIAPSVATKGVVALESSTVLGTRTIHLFGLLPDPLGGGILSGPGAVQYLLPVRGMIRIGDEYISYSGLDATTGTLSNIVRARRQDTIADGATAASWPGLQAHHVGDRAVPGGFRLNPQTSCKLFHGGCLLVYPFRNPSVPLATFSTNSTLNPLPPDALSIPVANTTAWPLRGFVRVSGLNSIGGADSEIMYYDHILSGNLIIPPVAPPLQGGRGQFNTIPLIIPGGSAVLQISFEVDKPILPDWYPTSDPPPGVITDHYLQLYHPDHGSAEWIAYTDTINVTQGGTTIGHFVDRNYAYGHRGQQRTIPEPSSEFPPGTRVIPVQDSLPNAALLATGDVITLMPRSPSPTHPPRQVCVRYVPCDAFPVGTLPLDQVNYYFAFTDALPANETWACGGGNDLNGFDLLSWPCWNGHYLGQVQSLGTAQIPPAELPAELPFHVNFAVDPANPLNNSRVIFGGADKARLANPALAEGFTGRIDGLAAGRQVQSATMTGISDPMFDPAALTPWLSATGTVPTPFALQTDAAVLGGTGLVQIGGEVFAYRGDQSSPPIPTQATLIGRGLLGSPRSDHYLGESVLVLPIGPVSSLDTFPALPEGGPVAFHDGQPGAPALLMCDANNGTSEIIAAPNGVTAPWLRGLYGTAVAPSWPAGSIAIGWWPRYPSPLARIDAATTLPEAFRCRTYPWASFPIRFHDTYFPLPATSGTQVFEQELLGNPPSIDPANIGPGTAEFSVFIAALAGPGQDDWNNAKFLPFTTNAPDPFASPLFRSGMRPLRVDGAEVRALWTYAQAAPSAATDALKLFGMALRANHAPTFGGARLSAQAPSKILAVLPQ